MWIQRDISDILQENSSEMVQIVTGPRQSGKSSLLWHLGSGYAEVSLDDAQARRLAQSDPALFLSQYKLPLIIDEVQYAPELLLEIKRLVDLQKRVRIKNSKTFKTHVLFRLTGSNQLLIDKNVRENLAGRAGYYFLNTLSVSEILRGQPKIALSKIMFAGGWPELYVSNLNPVKYLNDYILTYIEKDIVLSAGITKQSEFQTVLGLLAARTGEWLNYSAIAQASGVRSVTVRDWVSILERMSLLYVLQPYESNLNKRLIKSPKIYFLDTGLACRLQGWTEEKPMFTSPQAGHLFETLVLAEIIKFKNNHGSNWDVFAWRTKEGEEIDFILQKPNGDVLALEAKLGIHSVSPVAIPKSVQKQFPQLKKIGVVSYGGDEKPLSQESFQLPLAKLSEYLKKNF